MASGFKVGATDLDDVFDPYVKGTKPGLTGYTVNGQDLRDRYAPIVYGATAPVTNFTVAGVGDLNKLFAKKGTAVYEQVIADPGYPALGANATGQAGPVSASASLTLKSDGTWSCTRGTSQAPVTTTTGSWFGPPRAGAGDDYQVRFVFTSTRDDGAVITNGASNWTSLSADRAFAVSLSSPDYSSAKKMLTGNVSIQIRRASDSVVLSNVGNAVNLSITYV